MMTDLRFLRTVLVVGLALDIIVVLHLSGAASFAMALFGVAMMVLLALLNEILRSPR